MLEVILSEKGKPLLVLNSFKFYKYRLLKSSGEVCWCCVNKNCRAKVYTIGEEENLVFSKAVGGHEHNSVDQQLLNRQKLSNGLKRKIEDSVYERPSKMVHRELDRQNTMLETLTSRDMTYIRNNLGRARRSKFPKLPTSTRELQECLNLLNIVSAKNEPFLLINNIEHEVVVFACPSNVSFMCQHSKFYMDGTFDYCPKYFTQLFTIHVYNNATYIPVAFCLLKNKLKSTYVKLFDLIVTKSNELGSKFLPEIIVIDFEQAIHSSVKESFPNSKIIGCRFHLAQAWYRKIGQLGLSTEYKDGSSDIGKWLHYVYGLTFLPHTEVGDTFSFELAEDKPVDERVTLFADYLTENYIAEDSKFPPEIWAANTSDTSRTTNTCESFHSKFRQYCPINHPNVYVFIEAIKGMQTDTYIKINSCKSGDMRYTRKNIERNIKFINEKIVQFKNKEISRYDFIKCMAYKFSYIVL